MHAVYERYFNGLLDDLQVVANDNSITTLQSRLERLQSLLKVKDESLRMAENATDDWRKKCLAHEKDKRNVESIVLECNQLREELSGCRKRANRSQEEMTALRDELTSKVKYKYNLCSHPHEKKIRMKKF